MVQYEKTVPAQLNALDANRDLFEAEFDLARIRLNESLIVGQPYEALGGGWI